MYDKYGEFDSAEEINRAAAAQLKEGDEEAIMEIAKENGICQEDAEDYVDGVLDTLVTVTTAATGKLLVEIEAMKPKGSCQDFPQELIQRCMEDKDFAIAVRKKGKNLEQFMANCMDYGWNHSWDVPKEVMNKTRDLKKVMNGHMCKVGLPDRKARKDIATKYYLGG